MPSKRFWLGLMLGDAVLLNTWFHARGTEFGNIDFINLLFDQVRFTSLDNGLFPVFQ